MTHYPGEESRRQVTQLSALGWTVIEIADFMGLNQETIRKYYRAEVKKGRNTTYHVATAKLYEKIKAGDYKAITFWLRTQRGWKDRIVMEHQGLPVQEDTKAILAQLTDEELEQLDRITSRVRGEPVGPITDTEGEGAALPDQLCEGDAPEL